MNAPATFVPKDPSAMLSKWLAAQSEIAASSASSTKRVTRQGAKQDHQSDMEDETAEITKTISSSSPPSKRAKKNNFALPSEPKSTKPKTTQSDEQLIALATAAAIKAIRQQSITESGTDDDVEDATMHKVEDMDDVDDMDYVDDVDDSEHKNSLMNLDAKARPVSFSVIIIFCHNIISLFHFISFAFGCNFYLLFHFVI